jgi:hypothetical protein
MRPPDDTFFVQLARRVDDATLLAAVDAVYAECDRAVAEHGPVCRRDGACCRFSQFGHRLFVTSPEIVHFLAHARSAKAPSLIRPQFATGPQEVDRAEACPLQDGPDCRVHAIRPLGCRLFFCESGAAAWGRPLYEAMLGRLRGTCRTCSLPYAYVEWTQALGALFRSHLLNPAPVRS